MEDSNIIFAYTREDGIADGTFVDLTKLAKDLGDPSLCPFKINVTCTNRVFDELIGLPDNYQGYQDVKGRLWDVMYMTVQAIRKSLNDSRCTVKMVVKKIKKDGTDYQGSPSNVEFVAALDQGRDGMGINLFFADED